MKHNFASGQALVTLLFFVVIAVTVTSASVIMILTNSQGHSKLEQGTVAYLVAESGIENALLRLLRNPTYCGEVLPVGDGSATITVADANNTCNGASPFTITSVGRVRDLSRTIQIVGTYGISGLTISSWREL